MKRMLAVFAAVAIGMTGLLISPANAATGDTPLKFGQTARYDDGLKITVSKPARFTPGEWSMTMGSKSGTPVMFTVRITNGTSKIYDPAMFNASVSSAGRESGQVFDSESVGSSPSTKLLPSRSVTFHVAYRVKNPRDIVMEVHPDFFDHAALIYTS